MSATTESEEKSFSKQKKADAKAKKGANQFGDGKAAFVNTTPAGQLKDFSTPMADAYDPMAVESAWDEWWEAENLFKPDLNSNAENFVMVIPPPNVTGTLHLGHALTVSIEDAVVRWNRMSGKNTLWVPGTDHAGIATQVVVEKKIAKEMKTSRHELGRDKFLEEVWKWKNSSGARICTQLRRVGASVDWSRERFTMDDYCSAAVQEAFKRMYKNEKIYRANRMVSWSCALRSAISNIEVEYMDVEKPTKLKVPGYAGDVEVGVMHSITYQVKDSEDFITVSTTRIETMLGDVAVAVHPDDERYKHFHGKELVHPFIKDRKMIIVTDSILVDMTLGTGAVKITPAHDPKDYQCGQRHNLPQINIFDDGGFMNANAGENYVGKHRFEVREKIIEDLKAIGAYKGKTNNPMQIGLCSRTNDIVEPAIRPQWWVDCKEMAKRSMDAVKNKELKILPVEQETIWNNWLREIQDWCISRQLWWGHRIPAYYATLPGEAFPPEEENDARWFIADSVDEAQKLAENQLGADCGVKVTQDPDVLDTWFSSGLFPFSVMGWPNKTADLDKFFPNTLLETGHDILFFWVARMVMMSLELTDKLPFTNVFLHTMVRDRIGRKMSKSLGNVIDPLDVVNGITLEELQQKLVNGNLDPRELVKAQTNQKQDFPNGIAQCGADALRFGLLGYTKQGSDINLDPNLIVVARQFCNKMWQATKFGLLNFGVDFKPPNSLADVSKMLTSAKKPSTPLLWILSKLHKTIAASNHGFTAYEFGSITVVIQKFFIDELCAVYLECVKPVLKAAAEKGAGEEEKFDADLHLAVLFACFDYTLRLLHPIMPFVTEELYHRLPGHAERKKSATGTRQASGSLMVVPYPKDHESACFLNEDVETEMIFVLEKAVSTVRSAKNSLGLTNKQRPDVFAVCSSDKVEQMISRNTSCIQTLTFLGNITTILSGSDMSAVPAGCMTIPINVDVSLLMPLDGLVDVAAEVVKTEKKLRLLTASHDNMVKVTLAPNYGNAKEEVRNAHQEKLEVAKAEMKQLQEAIDNFMKVVNMKNYLTCKVKELQHEIDGVEKLKVKYTPKPKVLKEGEMQPPLPEKTVKQLAEFDAQIVELRAQTQQLNDQMAAL